MPRLTRADLLAPDALADGPDDRTREEREEQRLEFARAMAEARARFATDAERDHLRAIALTARVLRAGLRPATEEQLYIGAYNARREELGRALWMHECHRMKMAVARVWDALIRVHRAGIPSPLRAA